MVLEDYLRLKKLFAQRMVQKAASCHSSISEVAGRARDLCAVPQPWGCTLALSLSLSLLLPSFSQSLELSSQLPKRAMSGGAGSQTVGSPRDGLGTEALFLTSEEP